MVDFYWFPDLAIPLDPFSWGETSEDEFLAAVGSPFYWIGEDEEDEEEAFKPSMLENIMADGPTDHADPTFKWYNYEHVREYWEGGPLGTELIKDIDNRYGVHLPAELLFQAGLPKLSREQEARFASGKLGEIARERLDLETDEDNLLRPILKSMTDIQNLKVEYDDLSALLEAGDIDKETFELKTAPSNGRWKISFPGSGKVPMSTREVPEDKVRGFGKGARHSWSRKPPMRRSLKSLGRRSMTRLQHSKSRMMMNSMVLSSSGKRPKLRRRNWPLPVKMIWNKPNISCSVEL